MSVGGGKDWRRWRNVGGIMGKDKKLRDELKDRFGIKPSPKPKKSVDRTSVSQVKQSSK